MSTLLKRAVTLGLSREQARREEILALAQTGALVELEKRLPQLLMQQQGDGQEICEAFTNGFLIHGRFAEATSLIQQWQQAYPQDALPDVMLGRVREFDYLPDEAEKHYRHALQKNSADLKAAYGLGRVLMSLNRIPDAADQFRRGLTQPKKAPFQLGLGRCLILLGREGEAAEHLQSAAAVPRETLQQAFHETGESTEFDEISLELGTLEINREHYEEAIHWLKRALDYNPLHRQAHYQLATALRVSGHMAEAQPHFDWYAKSQSKFTEFDRLHNEISANPSNPEARYRLGVLCLEMDSSEAGLFWLRSVLSMNPNHSQAHAALAAHYTKLTTTKPEYQQIANYHRRRIAANTLKSE